MNMLNGRIYTYGSQGSFLQRFLGTLIFLFIVVACFYLFYQIYVLLFYASPVFIIASLIINPKIVSSHLKMIGKSFQQNPLAGLLELGLQIIGLPIVSIGLLIKAWAYKKFGQIKEEQEAQSVNDNVYTQYEEIKPETPVLDNNNLYASENKTKSSNSYDDLFE